MAQRTCSVTDPARFAQPSGLRRAILFLQCRLAQTTMTSWHAYNAQGRIFATNSIFEDEICVLDQDFLL